MNTENTKHTPGPWIFDSSTGYISSKSMGYVPIKTPFVEDAFKGEYGEVKDRSVDEPGTVLANARLIASAPELLERLKKLERILRAGPIPVAESATDLADYACAAITKAEGSAE